MGFSTYLDLGLEPYSPPSVDRPWGIWGSYYNVPKPYSIDLTGTILIPGVTYISPVRSIISRVISPVISSN